MSSPPKLHLNEHLSPRLAEQLRHYGFDVTSTIEEGMMEVEDDEQLAFAAKEHRAIVTFNHKHFAVHHIAFLQAGKEHWGIILSTEEPIDILCRRLIRLLKTLSADDLRNQVRWLNEFK